MIGSELLGLGDDAVVNALGEVCLNVTDLLSEETMSCSADGHREEAGYFKCAEVRSIRKRQSMLC